MKAIILTEGGQEFGFGHVSRCVSLFDAFSINEVNPHLIINGDDSIIKLVMNRSNELCNWVQDLDGVLERVTIDDIVVVDSYIASLNQYKKIADVAGLAVYLDDENRLKYPPGVILNSVANAANLGYSDEKNTLLLGNAYYPLRIEFCGKNKQDYNTELKDILVLLGGSDMRNLLPLLVDLKKEALKGSILHVVLTSTEGKEQLIENECKEILFHIKPSTEELINLMLMSDAAISAAGQTLFELISLGVPTIAIIVADNQKHNVESLTAEDAIRFAGYWTDENMKEQLLDNLGELSSQSLRKKLGIKGASLISGNGALNACGDILKIFKQNKLSLRKAKNEDIKNVFDLSNEDDVRRNSINQEKIDWEDHIVWFENKLSDVNCDFYILNDYEGDFVGMVRYDIGESAATVSISIRSNSRGLGYASHGLVLSAQKLFEERQIVDQIKALILPENIGSVKAFKKAGYRKTRYREMQNGSFFDEYILNRK